MGAAFFYQLTETPLEAALLLQQPEADLLLPLARGAAQAVLARAGRLLRGLLELACESPLVRLALRMRRVAS